MNDRYGRAIVPGSVVFEVSTGGPSNPGIVLADGKSVLFTPWSDIPYPVKYELKPGKTSGDGEWLGAYDLYTVEASEVDWASFAAEAWWFER